MIGSLLTRHARLRATHPAVIFGESRLTFAAFDARVNRLANALLAAGVARGDRVACVLPNGLEILDLYWATAKIGAVAVPLSPLLTGRGLKGLIDHCGATMLFLAADKAAELDPSGPHSPDTPLARRVTVGTPAPGHLGYEDFVAAAPASEPNVPRIATDAPLMIVYSSGTTGDPKGIVLSHAARVMYCTLYASAWRMTPESVSLHAGSLVFNGAFMTLLPSFFLGGTYILHEQFDPEHVLRTIAEERVTHMVMVPSQITALLECPAFDPAHLRSLEALISLGATLHLPHKERLVGAIGDRFYEMYGLAEGFMTILDKSDARSKLASVGTPPPFFDMRIVDEAGADLPVGEVGEIVGRGPIMMDGYFRRPDLTAKAIVDGWLHSGDAGFVDADGYLHLSDRKKDMIKSGGVSVYPRDIEEVLVQHPAIREAAVFGVPHAKWGETPIAAVVLRPGAPATASDLKAWVNANVSAKFQRVSDLIVLDVFPRNAAGKTVKRALVEAYLGALPAKSASAAE